MVKVSYEQKPYRRSLMEVMGAKVYASPSEMTETGRKALRENPSSLGSLGLAISEAVEDAAGRDDTNYSLGSVLNHVLLHQSIIGLECLEQFKLIIDYPDVVIAAAAAAATLAASPSPLHENQEDKDARDRRRTDGLPDPDQRQLQL